MESGDQVEDGSHLQHKKEFQAHAGIRTLESSSQGQVAPERQKPTKKVQGSRKEENQKQGQSETEQVTWNGDDWTRRPIPGTARASTDVRVINDEADPTAGQELTQGQAFVDLPFPLTTTPCACRMPRYMIENLEAAVQDLDSYEIGVVMATLIQLQGVVSAQAAQVLRDRQAEARRAAKARAREDDQAYADWQAWEKGKDDDDTHSLMQQWCQ